MTDISKLAQWLFERVEWQRVPNDVSQDDLSAYIAGGIRHLYVITGRAAEFSDSLFEVEGGLYVSFAKDLLLDEEQYVLLTAEINFYKKVQTNVDDLVSYTTDAMSVTHGDKPFANIQQKLNDLEIERQTIWYKMSRYHLL